MNRVQRKVNFWHIDNHRFLTDLSFPTPKPVAIPRLNNSVCPTLHRELEGNNSIYNNLSLSLSLYIYIYIYMYHCREIKYIII